jgi:hypothetical protein
MSGWDDYHAAEEARNAKPRTVTLRRDQLPADIRALLDDPQRPRAMTSGDWYPIHRFIMDHSAVDAEYYKLAKPDYDPLPPHGWVNGPNVGKPYNFNRTEHEAQMAEHDARNAAGTAAWKERSDAHFRALGIDPTGVDFYGAVDSYVREFLRAEVAAFEESTRPTASGEDADLAAMLPLDGEGVGYADLETKWATKRRSVERIVARLVDADLVRSEDVPSARGGKPKKLFWRVEEDES